MRRNSHCKRSAYVSKDESLSSGFSSSEEESMQNTRHKNKVRNSKSIKMLMKKSNSYEKSEDHAYTLGGNRKRSRNDSDSDSFYETTVSKKPRCESKNAINARINRERKKAYVISLEEQVQRLKQQNDEYSAKMVSCDEVVSTLRVEVTHLKSLLANNKHICALVNKLSEVTGLPVTSSVVSKMKEVANEPEPRLRSVPFGGNHPIAGSDVVLASCPDDSPVTPIEDSLFPSLDECPSLGDFNPSELLPFEYPEPFPHDSDFGVCVHINQNRLSVEFCSVCNARAMSAWRQ